MCVLGANAYPPHTGCSPRSKAAPPTWSRTSWSSSDWQKKQAVIAAPLLTVVMDPHPLTLPNPSSCTHHLSTQLVSDHFVHIWTQPSAQTIYVSYYTIGNHTAHSLLFSPRVILFFFPLNIFLCRFISFSSIFPFEHFFFGGEHSISCNLLPPHVLHFPSSLPLLPSVCSFTTEKVPSFLLFAPSLFPII